MKTTLVLFVLLVAAPMALAQAPDAVPTPAGGTPAADEASPNGVNNWGPDPIITWVPAASFTPRYTNAQWAYQAHHYYARTGGTNMAWEANVDLPNGAYLVGFRVYYYDNEAANGLSVHFVEFTYDPGTHTPGTNVVTSFVSEGASTNYRDTFADANKRILLRDSTTGDTNHYTLVVELPTSINVQFKGVRLWWLREPSPKPATATFSDVPTDHMFHQFVEALAASGITAGCASAPLRFCPDDPVTRGQMAVFLSSALGLHWSAEVVVQ